MSKTIKEKISSVLRIMLGVCFILSGIMKAVNVYSFAQEIRLYVEAYMDSFCVQWTVEIAVVICAIETITGMLALRKNFALIVAAIFLGMMSFFVWLTGINLFSPSLMGSIESCGCFGELIHFTPLASFVKSMVLWIMSVGLIAITSYQLPITIMSLKRIFQDGRMYMAFVAGGLPPVYSYFFFEYMEHGVYLIGYVALCVLGGGLCLVFKD